MERTLVFVKPHAVKNGDVFEILAMIEPSYPLVGIRILEVPGVLAAMHYKEHEGKDFYEGLIQQLTGELVVAAIFEGPEGMIQKVRDLVGVTDPARAKPGTIRATYGESVRDNAIHASDSPESAEREISLWFRSTDLVGYRKRLIDPAT